MKESAVDFKKAYTSWKKVVEGEVPGRDMDATYIAGFMYDEL